MVYTTYETSDLAQRIAALDAPSNLGLRPPAEGVAPGVYKLAGALRDTGLLRRLDAVDAGVVTPPRYLPAPLPGETLRNEAAQARYALRLADRVGALLDAGAFPLVLGGDCSILLGPALALARRGRYGLFYVDGHDDFTHPGNADDDALSTAGQDVALVTGRGGLLADLEGRRPLVDDADVVHMGAREVFDEIPELREAVSVHTSRDANERGGAAIAADAAATLAGRGLDGVWLHVDADVIDCALMPAVDAPETDGIGFEDLEALLAGLLGSGLVIGMQVTILDPDLDEDGTLVARFADILAAGLAARTPVAGQRR
jgi:arginase